MLYNYKTVLKLVASDQTQGYILQITKAILEKFSDMLETPIHLPQLMAAAQRGGVLRLGEDFSLFTGSAEWATYIENVVRMSWYYRRCAVLASA